MKGVFSQKVFSLLKSTTLLWFCLALLSTPFKAFAVTKTSNATGNWSTPGTWSPNGIPAPTDDVIIHGGNVVTIDGAYTCNNLDLGDATAAITTLSITAGGNSLTINGDLRINPSNKVTSYNFGAGPGTINVAGTFSSWSTFSTTNITVSTGTLTFAPAVTIADAKQSISFTAAGTINFQNSFTDSYNKLVTFTGCTVNFGKSYTVNTTNASWAGKGTAVFAGSGYSIVPTSNLTLFNATFNSATTINTGGTVIIGGDLVLGSGSTLTASQNFEVDGNWTNNGGTLSGGSNTLILNGNTKTIGGTTSTAFPNLQIGNTAVTVAYTINTSASCSNLAFNSNTTARTLTITTGDTLTVNTDITLNQPTAAVTNTLAVNGGTCIAKGNLTFSGVDNTTTYVAKVAVSTGLFSLTGNVTWMSNTAVATEVITNSTGTLTFGSSVTMGSGSGTLSVTSTGTINFNGTTAPSFTFGGATAPVFTTTAGCNLYFSKGFTNNTNALVLNATSNTYFTGNGSITPGAAITFGNFQLNASAVDTLAAGSTVIIAGNATLASSSSFTANNNFEVDGNWTNNGGTLTGGSNTVFLNGNVKTIGGTSATTFPTLQIGNSAVTVSYTMNNSNTCSNLIFNGTSLAGTFTITTGDTLTVTGNLTMNQPTAAVTNTLAVNGGTCIVNGTLTFTGIDNTATFVDKIAVTTGYFSVAGNITWMSNTAVATEVITVTTGIITFGSSLNMGSGSGTLSVTGTGVINFNGTTAPSFTFGGATAPVFTTAAGCSLYFSTGFTNNTNALVLNATSNCYFTGNGSVTPGAAITFGNFQLNASAIDTLATGSTVIIAGNLTISSGATFKANQNFELDGNWTNNGGTFSDGTNTVFLNGNVKSIGGTGSTAFYNLQIGNSAVTVSYTMNNSNSCNNLTFHSTTTARTLTIALGATFTVSGNVTINQGTAAVANTLAVGAGTCTVTGNLIFVGTINTASWAAKVTVTSGTFTLNGTVTWMSNTAVATEVITVTTGTITFANSLTMGSGTGTLSVTSTGTINFNGTTAPSFSFGGAATVPVFTTAAGCNLYFAKGITNNTNTLTINATSNTYFTGNGAITPNAALNFGNVQVNASAVDTLAAGAGAVKIAGNFTLSTGSSFTASKSFEVDGNWTNNGTSFSGGANTVTLNGTAKTIGGSTSTTFPNLTIGASAVTVSYTMNKTTTCTNLIFAASTKARTLTLTTGDTLNVTGNLTIAQPTANAITNSLTVNGAVCVVTGNLSFTGNNATTSRIGQIAVTSGSFTLNGTLTWMANTVVATEVISVTTGTLTFGSSITMGSASGTLSVTGAATVNFNGAVAPSFSFGGATAPVFTTVSGCTVNIKKGITAATTALTFTTGSTQSFTGSGTITPTAAITFGNLQINSTFTATLAGSISVTGNWNNSGTLTPSTFAVTFNGSGTQTITRSGGETFYTLTALTVGGIIQLINDVTITNTLNMTGQYFDLNSKNLILGNSAVAALNRTAGWAYGGTWKRWFPASAITSNSGSYYGLFPIGSSTDYKVVNINTTASPTVAGYVTAIHTNANTISVVSYTDNDGSVIYQIGDMHTDLATTTLSGGTYNLDVSFATFNSAGNASDLKLETHTGGVMGSFGTHVSSTGTAQKPITHRTGLTMAQLTNTWVVGTNNKVATPLYQYYYSRKNGNWNDATVGNGSWSFTPGGSGPSCDCTPGTASYEVICNGNTVTVSATTSTEFLDIYSGGTLAISSGKTLTVNGTVEAYGTGTFTNSGTFAVTGDLVLAPSGSSSATSNVSVGGELVIPPSTSYTQSGGTLTVTGNLVDSGTLSIPTGGAANLNGSGTTISGPGAITTGSGGTFTLTNNKLISTGTVLTIGTGATNSTIALATATTVTSAGAITLNGNITGTDGTSIWHNNAKSLLNITGTLMATGTFDATVGPNTVNYSGTGAQTIKVPATSYYNLTASDTNTKSLAADIQVDDSVTITGYAVLDESTHILSGNASLNMAGTSELKLQRSVLNIYPELLGPYSLTGGTVTINQTADSNIIESRRFYNLKFTGSTPYDISGISNIDNNFNVQSTSTITNNTPLTIAGTFTYSSSGYSTQVDDISAGAVALNAGTLDDGGNNITVTASGGWSLAGGAYVASGKVTFSGPTAQNIGGTTATAFHNLAINNTGNVTLNVSPAAPTTVANNLDMVNGNLITNSTNILRMLDTATVSDGGTFSFVSGPMVKVGLTDFVFPTGKGSNQGKVGISGLTTGTTEVTAEYFNSAYSSLTPLSGNLNKVSPMEYWIVTRAVTSDSLQMQLYWNNATGSNVHQCNNVTIAHWKGGMWVEEVATTVAGSACGGADTGSVLTTGYVTSFSPFTFGGYDDASLPIELLSFNANAQNNTVVQTNWGTALEINNAFFTVERSADGVAFSEVAKIDGAGTSSSKRSYEFTDTKPLPGLSYYRLRQTDFNGHCTLSQIVAVQLETAVPSTPAGTITVYPNPAHRQAFVHISNASGHTQLKIFDVSGWEVYNKELNTGDNSDQTIAIPVEILSPGVYLISTYTGNTESKEKLVIQ